jgi:hypothetical protein
LNFHRGKGDKDVKKAVKKTIAAFLDFSELIFFKIFPFKIPNQTDSNEMNYFFNSVSAMKTLCSA